MKVRDDPIPAQSWWERMARGALARARDEGLTLIRMGEELAEIVGRTTPYSHTLLSNFINGKAAATQELSTAIALRFGVPPLFYSPRSEAESRAMQAVASLVDVLSGDTAQPPAPMDPIRSGRRAQVLSEVEEQAGVDGHTEPVNSSDEDRRTDRGRPAGIHRRRPSSSRG